MSYFSITFLEHAALDISSIMIYNTALMNRDPLKSSC